MAQYDLYWSDENKI